LIPIVVVVVPTTATAAGCPWSSTAVGVLTTRRSPATWGPSSRRRATLPRLQTIISWRWWCVSTGTSFNTLWRTILATRHEAVEVVVGVADRRGTAWRSVATTPISTLLAFRTIATHMTRIATDPANHGCGVVLLFWTVILAMSDLTTY
jgi:hypothetical protein